MRCFAPALAVLAALCCAPQAAAENAPRTESLAQEGTASVDVDLGAAADAQAPPRMCFGGYEDGKIIVSQGRVKNAVVETTAKTCRIDGGSSARAPQSPLLAARRFAVLV